VTEDNNERTPEALIKAALNCFLNDEYQVSVQLSSLNIYLSHRS